MQMPTGYSDPINVDTFGREAINPNEFGVSDITPDRKRELDALAWEAFGGF